MFGPIFLLEWNYAARRSGHRQFRFAYSLLIAAEFLFFLYAWCTRGFDWWHRPPTWQLTIQVVAGYLPLFTLQHLLLLLLMTPALAAGSVSDEKNRGTFTLLFTTRLTAGEIVLSKWLGQTVQMLVLALPAMPVVVFFQAMLGVSPATVLAWCIETVVLVMLLAALSILTSVWARRTAMAIGAAYVLLIATVAGGWWAGAGSILDESALIVPLFAPAQAGIGAGWTRWMLLMSGLTATCVAMAAWRLRPACTSARAPRPRARWWAWLDRPPIHGAPVRWKERYIGELGLLAFARKLPRLALVILALAAGLGAALTIPGSDGLFVTHGIGMIVVAGLLTAVRSSGAICREREAHTWDALLMTPLEPYDLVRGKLWGMIDSIKPYLIAYGAGVTIWAASTMSPVAIVFTICCWGASWVFLYYHAANGLYHSARATGSWQALLFTLASGAVAILPRAAFAGVVAILSIFICSFIAVASGLPPFSPWQPIFATTMAIVLIAIICAQLVAQAELLLQQAEQEIAERDRIVQGRAHRGEAIYPQIRQADLVRR
jgi:ABC-2 family transporter protein